MTYTMLMLFRTVDLKELQSMVTVNYDLFLVFVLVRQIIVIEIVVVYLTVVE